MTLLDGKVAVISGVGPGMGRDIALLFAEHGASLVLGARDQARVESVADEARAAGAKATAVVLDVTDPAACEAAARVAVDEHGRIDVLVNNAFQDGDHRAFLDADLDRWRRIMEVNLFGTLQMTRAVVPAMRAAGGGHVVMINTMSVRRIMPRAGAYAASKAALESATKTLAVELGPHGIRVNGVHPGYVWGPSVEAYFAHKAGQRGITPDEVYREVADETCLGYLPSSTEIAGSVLFLASDLSKPVTGQSLGVNAGHWLY